MQPLARNVDFYGFLPKNSQDKVVQSSLHFANAVFIMDGKVQKYGRPDVFATQGDEAGCEKIVGGTVVWGKDDSKVANLLVDSKGFVVVFTKGQPGQKSNEAIQKIKQSGRVVFELSDLSVPHRLYKDGARFVLESFGNVDGQRCFSEVVVPEQQKSKPKQKSKAKAKKVSLDQAKKEVQP